MGHVEGKNGCQAGSGAQLFADTQFAEGYPVVAIFGPDWGNRGSFEPFGRTVPCHGLNAGRLWTCLKQARK